MKANVKGLGGIKHLFLAHGEKLGIAIVGGIALMMIYSSLLREKLPAEKAASKLKEQITMATQSMDGFTWDKMKQEFPGEVRLVVPIEQKGTGAIPEGAYKFANGSGWDAPVVPPVVLRTDPVLLDPQGLEARGGSGLLAFVDPEVRRQKMLEEQKKAAENAKLQKAEQEKQQADEGKGKKNNNRGGEADQYGEGVYDPAHPNRRAVVGIVRPAGVPLQDYEDVQVAHWAIVVAKVPIKEQLKLFRDSFENARGFNQMADVPQYLGYLVERAEVGASDDVKNLKWEPVFVYNGRGQRIGGAPAVTQDTYYGKPEDPTGKTKAVPGVTTSWAAQSPEIVDPRFLEGGLLAFPLPPLVGRDWGAEMTHSEIPLAIDNYQLEEDKKTEEAKPEKPGDTEPADPFASSGPAGMAAAGGGPAMRGGGGYGGGPGGMQGEGRGGGGYGGPAMRGGGGYGGGYGGGMMEGRGGGEGGGGYGGGGRGQGGLGQTGVPQAPQWLLRFVDFSVQPGKKYKYRVRLALLDPNQSFGGRFVGLEELDKDAISRVKKAKAAAKPGATPYRVTEWSKPSGTVSIPLAGAVFVASSKAATEGFNKEPVATLLVESFGKDAENKSIQAAKKKDLKRGGVANMTEDAEVLADRGRGIDPYDNFKFQTNITVADIRGGERLTRDEARPSRVLLMGPGGQLFVQDELEDLPTVEAHDATFAKEPPKGSAGGMMGEGGYGGGRGGMMGGEGMGGGRGR